MQTIISHAEGTYEYITESAWPKLAEERTENNYIGPRIEG